MCPGGLRVSRGPAFFLREKREYYFIFAIRGLLAAICYDLRHTPGEAMAIGSSTLVEVYPALLGGISDRGVYLAPFLTRYGQPVIHAVDREGRSFARAVLDDPDDCRKAEQELLGQLDEIEPPVRLLLVPEDLAVVSVRASDKQGRRSRTLTSA